MKYRAEGANLRRSLYSCGSLNEVALVRKTDLEVALKLNSKF
jgi:hypothetical protein